MSSEDLLARAEEVAKRNSFLVLVGAGCLTPNQVPVSATKELGLTNQEEKDAKLIAVFRRDEPEQYQAFFLGVLKKFFKKEKKKMKIEKSSRIFDQENIEKTIDWFNRVLSGTKMVPFPVDNHYWQNSWSISYCKGKLGLFWRRLDSFVDNDRMMIQTADHRTPIISGEQDLDITIDHEKYLDAAKKIVRAYEKKTGRKARIIRDY